MRSRYRFASCLIMPREKLKATAAALLVTGSLGWLIFLGSRNLAHFDAALVGYAVATLFSACAITYRYGVWLQRPPTAQYFKSSTRIFFRFLHPRHVGHNLVLAGRRLLIDFAGNRLIYRRGRLRWAAHWLIMWGCIVATAFVFPLVFGWVHFETLPNDLGSYRLHLFGLPTIAFPIDSIRGFFLLKVNALVGSSVLVIAGVLLALRRRFRDHGAMALQRFGEDLLPLLLLFAISLTGLMLSVSSWFMKGYAFEFLNILHAATVIFTMLWLPFGKFFHIFQRPLQLGVGIYKDVAEKSEQACCKRCGQEFASKMQIFDLIEVEQQLGYRYQLPDGGHYQWICPRCRRAMLGLAQGKIWQNMPACDPKEGSSDTARTPGVDEELALASARQEGF